MTKDQLIAKYGEQWYEDLKKRNEAYRKARYKDNPEIYRSSYRRYYQRNKDKKKAYKEGHKEIYRIGCRDVNRLRNTGELDGGLVVHHLKYHADNNDKTWRDDIMIMTREEHALWHVEHPEFVALENVV